MIMAGIGPEPKDPSVRVRHGGKEVMRTITAEPSPQPELPEGIAWPQRTVEFWEVWGRSPLTDEFTEADWDFMVDTAAVHARFWNGDGKAAAELRLRLAKVGATAEDRARLRITFARADGAEKPVATEQMTQEDYKGLRLAAGA